MNKRTLYECFHAKVKGQNIYCEKGRSFDTSGLMKRLIRGDTLAIGACQDCLDFESMGPPLVSQDRGWMHIYQERIK